MDLLTEVTELVEDPTTITEGTGRCKVTQKCSKYSTTYKNLRKHYLRCHANPEQGPITVIPPGGLQNEDLLVKVTHREGTCEIAGCEGKNPFKRLRRHYETKHLRITLKCPECSLEVQKHNFNEHRLKHSGPTRCLECGKFSSSIVAVLGHIKREHKRGEDLQFILLDEEETEMYRQAKEASAERTAIRLLGVNHIPKLKETQAEFEEELKTPGSELFNQNVALRQLVSKYLTLPADAIMSYNAEFVSCWDSQKKHPKFVLEVIRRKPPSTFFKGTNYHADRKISPELQPTNKEFKGTGLHRGHAAAAGSRCTLLTAAASYYLSNVWAMWPNFNSIIRGQLEQFIRKKAKQRGQVVAIHFTSGDHPLGRVATVGNGVIVPPYISTVLIVPEDDGDHIYGWEHFNDQSDLIYDWKANIADPFKLLAQGGLNFNLTRSDFKFVSQSLVHTEDVF